MSRLLSVLLLASVAIAAPVSAQESRPERPYRGLFGSGATDLQQSLRVSGSVGGGFDSNLAEDARNALNVNVQGGRRSGAVGQFSGILAYSFSGDVASLSVSAGSSGRYYPSAERVIRRDQASLQGNALVGLGISVFGSASYAPFRVSSLYPVFFSPELGAADTDFDFGASALHQVGFSGGASWGWQLTRRGRLSASYRTGGRLSSADAPEQRSYESGGGFQYNLGRGLDLNLGYRYTEAAYGDDTDPFVTHSINAGVDFERALSFSRRTTLSFSSGTAATDDPSTSDGLRYHAVGSASLTHEIGRTWSASLSYNRSVRFTEMWVQPVFSDAVLARVAGSLNRRVGLQLRGGASTGRVSANDQNGFDTYFFDAGLNFALARFAAFGSSYRYHFHEFADHFEIAGIESLMKRHSAHVYVSLWIPIFERARRP